MRSYRASAAVAYGEEFFAEDLRIAGAQAQRLHCRSIMFRPEAMQMMYAADTRKRILSVMSEEKPNQREKVSFQYEQLRRYFPSDYTPKQMTESILQLLERERRRRLDRDAR